MTAIPHFSPEAFASNEAATRHFGFLVVPNFSMMCFSCALEPLRQANRLAGRPLYRLSIVTPENRTVVASCGLPVSPDLDLDAEDRFDTIIVSAGILPDTYDNPQVCAWLRKHARRGARIGAVSTGSIVLASAGLLAGRRATVHWESLDSFVERYTDVEVSSALWEVDRDRFTCAGGIAVVDMMHELIERDWGAELAGAVSDQFMHQAIRHHDDPQRLALRQRLGVTHERLLKVIELMEANLEEPLPREELAKTAGVSVRQVERLFRAYLGRTLGEHYLDLRLQRARHLLRQTSQSVMKVAVACGFVSASHFSRAYRQRFGTPPRADR
ncbi:MAG: GlxA family transcriptional regulator [Pseudomonadota bacterium]